MREGLDEEAPVSGAAPYVTVVLPAFRAADALARSVPQLFGYLESLAVTHEVVVVDDGSRDGGRTRAVAHDLGCRYVELARNTGKGAAVRKGMLAARGRYRIFTDADVPFELDTVKTVLHYLDFKEFHFVAGDRTLPESRYFTEVGVIRRIGSALCSTLVGRFIAGGCYDTQCGIKGFRAEVAEDLFGVGRLTRFAFDVELFYVGLKRNYDIKRIPVRLRANETSSVQLFRDGVAFVRDLPRIPWNYYCGYYRQAPRYNQTVPEVASYSGSQSLGEAPEDDVNSRAFGE